MKKWFLLLLVTLVLAICIVPATKATAAPVQMKEVTLTGAQLQVGHYTNTSLTGTFVLNSANSNIAKETNNLVDNRLDPYFWSVPYEFASLKDNGGSTVPAILIDVANGGEGVAICGYEMTLRAFLDCHIWHFEIQVTTTADTDAWISVFEDANPYWDEKGNYHCEFTEVTVYKVRILIYDIGEADVAKDAGHYETLTGTQTRFSLAEINLLTPLACSHSYDNACDTSCNNCGDERVTTHKWDAGKVTKEATCKATGVRTYTCTVCSTTNTETIAKTSHNYSDATCTAPKTCKICGAKTGVLLSHDYAEATCTKPKTCKVCGTTNGSAKGHDYAEATCTKPKTCKSCGVTNGSVKGHDYAEATCTKPKTCKSCGVTNGSAKVHDYAEATCTKAKTCKTCGATSGSAKGHDYAAATCTKAKTCKSCGVTNGSAKGHDYAEATCTKAKTCKTCGVTSGKALGHSYKDATCTKAKTCKTCGVTSGKALGHSYKDATCTKAKTCKTCGVTTGKALGHSYKTTTTKATLSKNGSIVKKCATCNKVASTKTIKYVKTIALSKTSYTYDGGVKTPTVTVKDSAGKKLEEGVDYTISYASGRKNVGTYKVTIKMKGDYSGTKILTFKITAASASKFTVSLNKTAFTYDGKVKTPTITVKDADGKKLKVGTDYSVGLSGDGKKVGTYTITVKFKGNYSGTKSVTFKVLRKAAVSTQPKTQKVSVGDKIQFTVKATGTGLKYQWQYSTNGKTWTNCSGSAAQKASYSFAGKSTHDGNYYRCKITDALDNVVYTSNVRAYVLGIEKQPVKKTVTKNKTAKFSVEASGNGLKYQWQYSTDGGKTWKTCSGTAAQKAAFSFKAKASQNGYYFRCKITDSAKNVIYTSKVKLTVKK